MEANVVNLAVPTLRSQFLTNTDSEIWIIDAYSLPFATLLISAGSLGNRFGVRKVCTVGLTIFGLSSIGCAIATTACELISFRGVQGIGAALIAPAPLTLITSMYSELDARAKAVALWGSISGLGFLIGPLVSGFLLSTFGWRSIFILNIPVILFVYWLVSSYVNEIPGRSVSFDFWGQILAIAGLASLVTGIIEASVAGWRTPFVLISVAIGVCMIFVFFAYQRMLAVRDRPALLPLAIFAACPVVAGVFGGIIFSFTLYGMALVYTFYFQEVLNYKPVRAGFAFAPLTLTAVLASGLITGRYIGKFGPKSGLASGMSLSALALGILSAAPRPTPFFIIAVSFVLFGIGMVISGPSQIVTVMTCISDEYRNLASGVLNSARQCGGLFGVAVLGAIVSNDVVADTPFAMVVGCGACLLGIVVAICFIPGLTRFHAPAGIARN